MRLLLAVAALALTACGDDIAEVRNQAEDIRQDAERTLDDLRSGATLDDVQRELGQVRDELDNADLTGAARQRLEDVRDELEQARRDLTDGR